MFERKFALSGIWTHVPPHFSRVWWPLHHQDNHAGYTAIDDVIYVVWNEVSREIFLLGDRVGEPITPIWNPTKDQVNDARPKST